MSPLTEKLAAILDDWDQLSSILADVQHQCTTKDGTITGLQQTVATQQQQLNRQASELAALKSQLSSLQQQATAALLTAADPDDARIKQRIESAFQSVAGKPGSMPAASPAPAAPVTVSHGPVRPATPTAFSDGNAAVTPVRTSVNSTGRLVIPGRAPGGNGAAKPPPQPQPQQLPAASVGSGSGILSIGRGSQGVAGTAPGSSRYSSSEEAS
jgi:uncharacterized coiled-coil protein SlyX